MNKKDRNSEEISDDLFISEELNADDYDELQMHCMLKAELSSSSELLEGVMSELKSTKKPAKIKTSRTHRFRKVKKRPSPIRWLLPACACLMIGAFFIAKHLKMLDHNKNSLVLNSGVDIKLKEGSEYKVLGDNAFELVKGEIQAEVPKKAIGFSVKTPHGKIVDLSTKFDLKSDDEKTVVKVTEGRVEVANNRNHGLVVYEGETSTILGDKSEPLIQGSIPKAEGLLINLNFGKVTVGNLNKGLFGGHWNNSANYPQSKMHNSLKKPIEMGLKLSDESSYQLKDKYISRVFDGILFKTWQEGTEPLSLDIALTEIPFKKYDIYVYYGIDQKGHVFDLSLGEDTYEIHSSGNLKTFKRWRGPTTEKSGNYQVFTKLSGKAQTIKASLGQSERALHHSWFISAIQIVERFD